MGRKYLTILTALIMVFSSLKTYAAMLTPDAAKKEIRNQIIAHYKKITDAQIEPEVLAVPFSPFVIPEGKVSYKVTMSTDKFLPRDLVKVEVSVNGKVQKIFNASVIIKAYKNVLVASCPIQRERPVNSLVVAVEKREISNIFAHVLTSQDLSKDIYAKKYFNKGEIIDERFVKTKPDILRNSQVTVFFNTNDLTISVDGIALADGVMGEKITVLNKTYNRVYKGVVVGENKVLVRI